MRHTKVIIRNTRHRGNNYVINYFTMLLCYIAIWRWQRDEFFLRSPFVINTKPEAQQQNLNYILSRMHSSRMRTVRLLTVSQHALPGGVPAGGWTCPVGGVPAWGCTCLGCVCTCLGGVYLPRYSPLWTERQTSAKILPFPKLRLRAVINYF